MLISVPKLKGATLEDVPIENGATEVMIFMNGNVDAVYRYVYMCKNTLYFLERE
jgi:hypothetical protein